MQFSTKIEIPRSNISISHRDKMMMIGSCFAENIGRKFQLSKFNINLNPFGILYNPLSISQSVNRLIDNRPFVEDELVEERGAYHSFWHHSRFSTSDKKNTLDHINQAFNQAHAYLKEADTLLVTFGTSYAYRLRNDGMVVGNCHKFPASDFEHIRLSVENIVEEWITLLKRLKTINPKIRILFTVSPIRHLKDGAHDNQLSKATLLLAIEQLTQDGFEAGYFPSYEMMMDELRDYRFYAEDMIHPSTMAIDYIWERFSDTYFSDQTKEIVTEWNKIAAAIAHRPFDENGADYKHFLSLTLSKIDLFKEKYPYICCNSETVQLNKKWQGIQ